VNDWEVFSGAHERGQSHTNDSCWSMETIYDPRELIGVSTTGPRIGWSVTSGIRADPRGFTDVCGLEGSSI
jgi:hypothetical protein